MLASLRAADHDVSDEEIFAILNPDGDGETAADLRIAKDVSLPRYCLWKTKYRHLSLDELRAVRRQELWRARRLRGALLAVVVFAAGGLLVLAVGLGRPAPPGLTRAPEPPVTTSVPLERHEVNTSLPALPVAPIEVRIAKVAADVSQTVSVPPKSAPVDDGARSAALPPSVETGFTVQVAAAPTERQAGALVQRLTAAGQRAYVSQASVRGTDVFRVRVGPFDTVSAAEEIAGQLQRDGYSGAWVVR